jgi:hypothetical protein
VLPDVLIYKDIVPNRIWEMIVDRTRKRNPLSGCVPVMPGIETGAYRQRQRNKRQHRMLWQCWYHQKKLAPIVKGRETSERKKNTYLKE